MEEMEQKKKKSIFKKWWFWLIVIVVIICIGSNSTPSNTSTNTQYQKNTQVEVSIIDFSTITRDEVQVWFDNNKINGTITEEYSDTIEKGNIISQSISAGTTAHEGDSLKVVYSLGKEPTTEQKNALIKAESYSKMMHMSKKGIYDQLISEYGEQFPKEAAQYAIDNIQADWNENALAKAKSYQETMNMSKKAIYDQLISKHGEQFTEEEAQYAIDHLDD